MTKVLLIVLCCLIAAVIIYAVIRKIKRHRFEQKVKRIREQGVAYFSTPDINCDEDSDACYSYSSHKTNIEDRFDVPAPSMCAAPAPSACPAPSSASSGFAEVEQVQFSAVSPKKITKGEFFSVDISVYEEEYREIVERIIKNRDEEVKEIVGSSTIVCRNTNIKIVLSSPDIELSDCEESQIWQGKYLVYNFIAELPAEYQKNRILFIATVYFNGVIATKLKFIVSCEEDNPEKIDIERKDITSAFVSYSSQDRPTVSTIIQGIRKGRPDLDLFCDIEKLHSGDDWSKVLFEEIEKRDVLFLCWSKNAKASHEVEKEWRHALETKGIDGIDPIPLVSPKECPPPEELKSKHFNDLVLLYRNI